MKILRAILAVKYPDHTWMHILGCVVTVGTAMVLIYEEFGIHTIWVSALGYVIGSHSAQIPGRIRRFISDRRDAARQSDSK